MSTVTEDEYLPISQYLPIGPFRDWLRALAKDHGTHYANTLISQVTGSSVHDSDTKRRKYLRKNRFVDVDIVDRMTLAVGGARLMHQLYPPDTYTLVGKGDAMRLSATEAQSSDSEGGAR